MTRPQLKKIEVHGFRSFGTGKQTFELPSTVAVLWGGNSQGKTSLTEAIEFLLTGQLVRRELQSSSKEEFSDCLRNVHIPDTAPVSVAAEVLCSDGTIRHLKRILLEDYKKGNLGCTSRVEIDGKSCVEDDILLRLGIKLSQAPLIAPVLAQHTLGYIFSAGPNERASYFRAVLDTQDLEDFRASVATFIASMPAPILSEIVYLQTVEAIPGLKTANTIRKSKTQEGVEKSILATTAAFLISLGITPAVTLPEQSTQISLELQNRRAKSFPLDLFVRSPFTPWENNSSLLDHAVKSFIEERKKIDAETRRLVDLFKAALSLPECKSHDAADCPLCGTKAVLTPERIQLICDQVKATETYQTAERAIKHACQILEASLSATSSSLDASLPKFTQETPGARRYKGFTIARLRSLVQDDAIVADWTVSTRHLIQSAKVFRRAIARAQHYIAGLKDTLDDWDDPVGLTQVLATIYETQITYQQTQQSYGLAAQLLGTPLKIAVDQSTNTAGWEELVSLAVDTKRLWKAIELTSAYEQKFKELDKAIKEIEKGNGKVADEKFDEMSGGVKVWWDFLRPNEPSFFGAIQRRSSKARRTIDIKVGLSANDDCSDPKFRDAVAVFSTSQLHCLGLAMFLARAVQEKTGFIVLDDPVLTSDDDFRPNFAQTVIEELLNEGVQVIVTTQDHSSWKDIGHRWEHKQVAQFQIIRNDPLLGTEIRNQYDGLATMLAKVQPYIRSHDPDQRREGAIKTRAAIERFCKEILVRKRLKDGEAMASITDYDGKNFGEFSNSVYLLLTKDPAHTGKLKAAHSYVTPGPHDDAPPSASQLATAYGDLKKLKTDYLD